MIRLTDGVLGLPRILRNVWVWAGTVAGWPAGGSLQPTRKATGRVASFLFEVVSILETGTLSLS